MASAFVAFLGGAVSEGICVFWVAASQRGHALTACTFSMMYAIAIERGIGEAIHGWPGELLFVGGFGFGTFAAVRLKTALAREQDR